MESSKLAVKLFIKDASRLEADTFVPIFHRWIQQRLIDDHLLIDVADYEHVHEGPGTMLIALEANYGIDHADAAPGLLYVRKLPIEGSFPDRLRAVFAATLSAAALLEQEPALEGAVQFATDRIEFRINDRLHGPNTDATLEAIRPHLLAAARQILAKPDVAITRTSTDPRSLFAVSIQSSCRDGVDTLLSRVTTQSVAS